MQLPLFHCSTPVIPRAGVSQTGLTVTEAGWIVHAMLNEASLKLQHSSCFIKAHQSLLSSISAWKLWAIVREIQRHGAGAGKWFWCLIAVLSDFGFWWGEGKGVVAVQCLWTHKTCLPWAPLSVNARRAGALPALSVMWAGGDYPHSSITQTQILCRQVNSLQLMS